MRSVAAQITARFMASSASYSQPVSSANLVKFDDSLKRNALAGAVYSAGATLLMAVSYPLYLRWLGYERYGLWLVLSTVLSFAQLGNLGLGQAVSKQVAAEHGRNNIQGINACVSTSLCVLLITGALICLVIFALRTAIAGLFHLSAANSAFVSSTLPLIGLLSLYAICLDAYCSTLIGLGRLDLYSYLQLGMQVVSVGITLAFLNAHHGILSFIIGNVTAYIGLHLATYFTFRRIFRHGLFTLSSFSFAQLRETLGLSLYLFGCSIAAMLLTPLNRVLLTRYIGVLVLPIYDIIFNGSMKVRSLLDAAVRGVMPEVSRIASSKSGVTAREQISALNKKVLRNILICGGPLYLVLMTCSAPLLQLWLGKNASSFPQLGLRITLLGTFVSLLGVPAFYTLLGLGKGSPLLLANILQSGIPVLLAFALLYLGKPLSLVYMLASVASGMVIANIYLIWQNKRAMSSLSGSA